VLLTGELQGLWLALVGWFLISAANAEQTAARFHMLLGRVPVRSVMSPNPVTGDPGQTVDDFVRTVAAGSPHRIFPVRDAAGVPYGVVRLADLARIPAARRGNTPLRDIATPLDRVSVVKGSDLLADVSPLLVRGGLSLVVEDGRLAGVLSADDLARWTELAALGSDGSTVDDSGLGGNARLGQ
jgi:CBS domain-containing protein